MIERLRRISYFLAYAVATIPLWHYIRDGRILAMMVAVMTFAYVMVVMSSVQAAQPILSSEKTKTVLPKWLPDKPKYHKWWMLVRRTLKWHLILVPPKMGLALGFAHLFYYRWIISIPFNQAYNYLTNIPRFYPHLTPDPGKITLLIALVVIVCFAICETFLIASISLLLKTRNTITKQITRFILIRFSISSLMLCICGVLQIIDFTYVGDHALMYAYNADSPCDQSVQTNLVRCLARRTLETSYLGLMMPTSQGILLSANITRPLGKIHDQVRLEDSSITVNWDNRPFVARQIVAGLLGLMLYAGATWVILWFVEDEEYQLAIE